MSRAPWGKKLAEKTIRNSKFVTRAELLSALMKFYFAFNCFLIIYSRMDFGKHFSEMKLRFVSWVAGILFTFEGFPFRSRNSLAMLKGARNYAFENELNNFACYAMNKFRFEPDLRGGETSSTQTSRHRAPNRKICVFE